MKVVSSKHENASGSTLEVRGAMPKSLRPSVKIRFPNGHQSHCENRSGAMSKLTLGRLALETSRGRVSGVLPAANVQELRQSLADRFCECGALMVLVDGKRQCAQERARALAQRAALESREQS
jgi:hypothetical protein